MPFSGSDIETSHQVPEPSRLHHEKVAVDDHGAERSLTPPIGELDESPVVSVTGHHESRRFETANTQVAPRKSQMTAANKVTPSGCRLNTDCYCNCEDRAEHGGELAQGLSLTQGWKARTTIVLGRCGPRFFGNTRKVAWAMLGGRQYTPAEFRPGN